MSKFEIALTDVLRHEEGDFHEINLHDAGGLATNFGISLNFYKKKINPNATIDDIRFLKVEEASHIYKNFFWDRNRYSEINNQMIAGKVFDLAVNIGAPTANSLLQKAINSISPEENLIVDGLCQAYKTIEAANKIPEESSYISLC